MSGWQVTSDLIVKCPPRYDLELLRNDRTRLSHDYLQQYNRFQAERLLVR